MAVGLSKEDFQRDLRALMAPAQVTVIEFPVANQWGIVVELGRNVVARRFDKNDSSLPSILEEVGAQLKGHLDDGARKGRGRGS